MALNRCPPALYHRVLRDGVRLLCRDAQRTTTREAQALSRYCDFEPELRRILVLSRHVAQYLDHQPVE